MFKRTCGFIAVLFLSLYCISFANAESEGLLSDLGFEISGDASVYSQYVWRGFVLDRDAVIQPSIYVSTPSTKFGKLKIGVWSNQDLQNSDNLKSEEFDYIIDYTYDFKNLSLSLGHTYYDFVDTSLFSREFYVGVAFPNLFLSPSVFFYRDYGKPENGGGSGNYTVISGFYSLPIKNTPLSLDLSGHVGFNHNQFIEGDGGDVAFKVGVTMPLTKTLSFTPNVNYSIPFGNLADEAYGNQKSRFFGGATLVYKF